MASSDSRVNKPQCGRPKRAELLDVNINTGVQSINTERALSPSQMDLQVNASFRLALPCDDLY